MKIARINAVYGIMSTGRSVQELDGYLTAEGHQCNSYYGECKADYGVNVKYLGTDFSHKLHALSSRMTGNAGHGSYSSTKRLIMELEEFKPDIIHLHNLHANFVHIPLLLNYIARKDIPTVVQLDDCFYFTGGCMHYTANGCDEWKRDCSDCKFLKRGKHYFFSNRARQNLAEKQRLFQAVPRLAVCGVSEWIANQAKQSPVFSKAKVITHVYNWIDLDLFTPQGAVSDAGIKKHLGISDRVMLLGVASGWSENKGLNGFLKIADSLDSRYAIVLVGQMPANVSLPSNVIHIPATENVGELAKFYSAADAFVHLSKEETFGKVIAEALACGTPAIVSNTTAMPELVDKTTGETVNPDDTNGIIAALGRINKAECSGACRKRAIENFSLTENCHQILSVYNSLLTES